MQEELPLEEKSVISSEYVAVRLWLWVSKSLRAVRLQRLKNGELVLIPRAALSLSALAERRAIARSSSWLALSVLEQALRPAWLSGQAHRAS
jgi:hypothetical protein